MLDARWLLLRRAQVCGRLRDTFSGSLERRSLEYMESFWQLNVSGALPHSTQLLTPQGLDHGKRS